MQHTLWPRAGHRCTTAACAGQQNLWGTVTTSCCGPRDPVQGEGQRIVAAKPLEAAPGSQHRWGPNSKTATGSPRAAWAMSPVHWEHLMGHPWKGRNLPLPLGQRTHLMASNSTVVRRGWGMDEKPALPPQRQEGRQWERMLPHHQQAPCLVDDRQPASSACQTHHRPGPGRSPAPPSVSVYLTGQSGSWCLVVILIIYSRYYKSSPCKVSAAHSPVQTCSRQTPQTWRLAVKQHTANRSNECEGRGGKKISKKEGVTPACFV